MRAFSFQALELVHPDFVGVAENGLHETYWFTPCRVDWSLRVLVEADVDSGRDTLIRETHKPMKQAQAERLVRRLRDRGFQDAPTAQP